MDKATTALIATEDNAAAIRALSSSLRELKEELNSRTTNKLLIGIQVTNLNFFGIVTSDGTLCVIVIFDEATKRTLSFRGKSLGAMNSPAVYILPEGTGNLTLSGPGAAKAILLAGSTV